MSNEVENWINDFYALNPEANRFEEEVKAKKENTLPLHLELSAMDLADRNFYNKLSDEHKKEISLWILMRYMSSSQGSAELHLLSVNSIVNENFNVMSKHPDLQWKLLTVCGTGKKQYHQWLSTPKKSKKNKLEETLADLNPLMKDDEIALLQRINTKEDFVEYFRQNAMDDKTIKELLKNFVGK